MERVLGFSVRDCTSDNWSGVVRVKKILFIGIHWRLVVLVSNFVYLAYILVDIVAVTTLRLHLFPTDLKEITS